MKSSLTALPEIARVAVACAESSARREENAGHASVGAERSAEAARMIAECGMFDHLLGVPPAIYAARAEGAWAKGTFFDIGRIAKESREQAPVSTPRPAVPKVDLEDDVRAALDRMVVAGKGELADLAQVYADVHMALPDGMSAVARKREALKIVRTTLRMLDEEAS